MNPSDRRNAHAILTLAISDYIEAGHPPTTLPEVLACFIEFRFAQALHHITAHTEGAVKHPLGGPYEVH